MAGYLRQLARQALQPGSPLHSVAALPYAAPPELAQEETLTGVASAATQATWVRTIAREFDDAVPKARRDAPRQPPIEPARSRFEPTTPPSPPPYADATPSPRRSAAKPGAVAPITTAGEPIVAVADPSSSTVRSPAMAPLPADTNPQRERRSADALPVTTTSRVRLSPERREPAVDLHATDIDRAPEVHIHIGRIELTATPMAAPKRVSAPAKKPMSLDEYLRQKAGS